jgi:uncharacterized protein YdeI (YjbR/CyaY-like superfamily)
MTIFSESAAAFRAHLHSHNKMESTLKAGFRTRPNGHACVSYEEALAEAIKLGWYARKRIPIDKSTYAVVFARRPAKAKWSAEDVAVAEALIRARQILPAGAAAFESRALARAKMDGAAASEELSPLMIAEMKRHPAAWTNFQKLPAAQRRKSAAWVMSAKQEKTRSDRFGKLMMDLSRPRT